MVPLRFLLVLFILLVLPPNADANAGILAPQVTDRYVSPAGTDNGDCTNSLNPCQTIDYARGQSTAGDTIHLAAGVYVENVSLYFGINLVGAGADTTIIDGDGFSNVVYIFNDSTPTMISHLTIRNGMAEFAGGVGNLSHTTLDHVIIENNTVSSQGGGIYNEGELTMLNCIVRNNTSTNVAAGMINHATAEIRNSTFVGNKVTSSYYGGAIHNNVDADMELENVTISGNQAANAAGINNSGTVDMVNVTITNNIGEGIGLFNNGSAVNTIVAGNTVVDCGSAVPSLGNNLESGTDCGFTEPSDLQNTPALLQPLGYYSSSIPTHSPYPGSPAVDSANGTYCPDTDARGIARPIDGDGVGGAACDRGAHEYDPATDFPKLFLPLVARN